MVQTLEGSPVAGVSSSNIKNMWICALVKQKFDHSGTFLLDEHGEGCPLLSIREVDVAPSLEQFQSCAEVEYVEHSSKDREAFMVFNVCLHPARGEIVHNIHVS